MSTWNKAFPLKSVSFVPVFRCCTTLPRVPKAWMFCSAFLEFFWETNHVDIDIDLAHIMYWSLSVPTEHFYFRSYSLRAQCAQSVLMDTDFHCAEEHIWVFQRNHMWRNSNHKVIAEI